MSEDCIRAEIGVSFEYDVYFTRGVFCSGNDIFLDWLRSDADLQPVRVLFFIEQSVADHHPDLFRLIEARMSDNRDLFFRVSPQIISGGELKKTFDAVADICRRIQSARLCRHSYVGIIGGGAFLDVVGFAASIVHRGLRQIRFPTTVLSQNDSGVGVKTGLNMFGQKNYLGTFAPPASVFDDFDFLDTLEERDWKAGVAEAFKVALIKDALFFQWLCKNAGLLKSGDKEAMEYLVRRCAGIHLEHIVENGDPFETGSARPLDFGHWAAHKLEMMTDGAVRHGEAVAIGLLLDTRYAVSAGLLEQPVLDSLVEAFNRLGFDLYHPSLHEGDERAPVIFDGIEDFREHLGGLLHITLPDGLGRKKEVNELDRHKLLEAVDYLRKLTGGSGDAPE